MPGEVAGLAAGVLTDPVRIEVTPPATTVERIEQRVLFVARADKPRLLGRLLAANEVGRAIVFTRTKHGANRVVEQLQKAGLEADAIHGNKSQGARQRALARFRTGRLRALVATDIAARGIDVDGVTHVINFDLPVEPEGYVHRIGRTGRAGADGVALSLCGPEEVDLLVAIEKTIGRRVPVDDGHPFHLHAARPTVRHSGERHPPIQANRGPDRRGKGIRRRSRRRTAPTAGAAAG
jgi:ATP-dependent RNA helicase RhlE